MRYNKQKAKREIKMEKEKKYGFGVNFKYFVIFAAAVMAFILGWRIVDLIADRNSKAVQTVLLTSNDENNDPIEKKYTVTSEFLEKKSEKHRKTFRCRSFIQRRDNRRKRQIRRPHSKRVLDVLHRNGNRGYRYGKDIN